MPLWGIDLQKKKYKSIKTYKESVKKEHTDKRRLLILNLKPFW